MECEAIRPRIIDEGILHKNLNPGLRAEAAFLPNVVPISATEALCFYRIGTAPFVPGDRGVERQTV